MKYRRILLLAVAAMTILAFAALGALAPTAQATLPPGTGCVPTPTPGTGKILWYVSAKLPEAAGQNANGVCINCTGTGGENNTATLQANAAGCLAPPIVPAVGAGSSYVWADWGTNNCVAPGNTVRIQFKSSGFPLTVDSVKWNLADGSVIDGTGSARAVVSVGGIAELPDVAHPPAGQSSSSDPPYAALAGGLAAAVAALMAGAWYARRRWVR